MRAQRNGGIKLTNCAKVPATPRSRTQAFRLCPSSGENQPHLPKLPELCGAGTPGPSLWKRGGCSAHEDGESPRGPAPPRPSAPIRSVTDTRSEVCWEPRGTVLHPRGTGLLPGSDGGWKIHLLVSTMGPPALTRGHPAKPTGSGPPAEQDAGARQRGTGVRTSCRGVWRIRGPGPALCWPPRQ